MAKTIAITGASGFIGKALVSALTERGYNVVALDREKWGAQFFEGVDAVIHLAGEPVDGRWTPEKKRRIQDSRVLGTRALVTSLAACARKPEVLVCASGAGYYGSRGDETLTEKSSAGNDFLAAVVIGWERECEAARAFGMRTVSLRMGIVLGAGGALAKMVPPFRSGFGGPFGSGNQFVPWIHLDDVVAMYIFAIENQTLSGPVNAVAPDYATSTRFAFALGNALSRPAYLPTPGFALHAMLGQFAETILASELVIPAVAEDAGFKWTHTGLEEAMIASVSPGKRRMSQVRRFEQTQHVSAPLETVFPFFSEVRNLESITPPNLSFRVLTVSEKMERGAQISYNLRVHGIPMKWKTLISKWHPPYSFVDFQMHGPYMLWKHQHDFTPVDGGVVLRDTVNYVLPFPPLGNIAHGFVESDVRRIFNFRRHVIEQRFCA